MTTTNTPLGDEGLAAEIADLIRQHHYTRNDRVEDDHTISFPTTHYGSRAAADAILALLASRDVGGAVGWKLVPIEPTEAMLAAVGHPWKGMLFPDQVASAWKIGWAKMLSAAPDHPQIEQPECVLCAGKCRGHSLADESTWKPEPGSAAAPVEQPSIPAGMVAWHGGDEPPEDWDGGEVISRRGHGIFGMRGQPPTRWKHLSSQDDIIAYTPRPNPSEQLAKVERDATITQAQAEAYERAAKVADTVEQQQDNDHGAANTGGAAAVAAAIRALSPEHRADSGAVGEEG